MAFLDALTKAKRASEYKFDKFEIESSSEKLESSENPRYCEIFEEIWSLKQETADLKIQIQRQKLNTQWQNKLAGQEIFENLDNLEKNLDAVNQDKDNCLEILRNPETSSENSLSLKRDRQNELIQAFEHLVKIIHAKPSHLSDLNWINNQNWPVYGQELIQINRKLLHLEAALAKELQEIKSIRKNVESN